MGPAREDRQISARIDERTFAQLELLSPAPGTPPTCAACDGGRVQGGPSTANDVARERAELYLLHELKVMPGWPRHYARSPPDELGRRGFERDERAHVLQQFRGSVEVLAAIGILGEGEAAAWLSRFLSAPEAEEPGIPEPDRGLATEERARRLLEERLAQAAAAPGGEDERATMARFDQALRAVRVTGALSREEIERFSGRLGEAASVEAQEWFRARPSRRCRHGRARS